MMTPTWTFRTLPRIYLCCLCEGHNSPTALLSEKPPTMGLTRLSFSFFFKEAADVIYYVAQSSLKG